MEDLEYARKQWLLDEPRYAAFGSLLRERLQILLRTIGVPGSISVRTKEVDSLLKKLIRKPEKGYADIGDRLGVRIVVKRLRDVTRVGDAVASAFACGPFENKADKLAEDQVGYLSVHVDITLRSSDARVDEFRPADFSAELQVRTLAQNVWSEMAHDTAYKSGNVVHHGLKRRLHLLAALIEVADNDYQRVEDEIGALPDIPELQVLRVLERQYYKLASRPGDVDLSLRVIRLLWPLYSKTPEELSLHFAQLFTDHQQALAAVFEQAEATAAERSAFLFQPEVLMIYDQLASMPYRLRSQWSQEFPEKELERIAVRFGFSFA
jgi:ppGpp synthetase/RelA/SpoT-type nucleotidyltranferase